MPQCLLGQDHALDEQLEAGAAGAALALDAQDVFEPALRRRVTRPVAERQQRLQRGLVEPERGRGTVGGQRGHEIAPAQPERGLEDAPQVAELARQGVGADGVPVQPDPQRPVQQPLEPIARERLIQKCPPHDAAPTFP